MKLLSYSFIVTSLAFCVHLAYIQAANLTSDNSDGHINTRFKNVASTEQHHISVLLPVRAFGNQSSEEANKTSTRVLKHRKRITPIMFIHPISDGDTCSSSKDDFPSFLEGNDTVAIVLAFLIGIYCFTLLAIICDNYFLPCVERICEALNLSQDVAAATFMAMATSAPELFVNIIGTFITESDIGIGTIVGSSMFNTLGVAALGSIAATSAVQLDWWPVTRDCTLYCIAISLLVIMAWDGYIFWYEGMILFIVYFLYFGIMFNNKRISRVIKGAVAGCCSPNTSSTEELSNIEKIETTDTSGDTVLYFIEETIKPFDAVDYPHAEEKEEKSITKEKCEIQANEKIVACTIDTVKSSEIENLEKTQAEKQRGLPKFCRIPNGGCAKVFFIYTWPLKFLLFCTVPNPKTHPRLFPFTFIMCILYMGANSYVVSWMIANIGAFLGIADSVLGLTFLAAGGCLPEAISVIIMSRKGEGSMGVSNALGGNTMNILLSLGLPWFIKTMMIDEPGQAFIEIQSGTMEYTILGLMLVAFALYLTLYFNKFQLAKRTGIILSVVYLIFLTLAILSEMLVVETPSCND